MIEAQTGTNYNGDHIHLSILPTTLTWTAPFKVCADNADNRVCNTWVTNFYEWTYSQGDFSEPKHVTNSLVNYS
jgi:hypothetical protein